MSEPIRNSVSRTITEIQRMFGESQVLKQRYQLDIEHASDISSSGPSTLQQIPGRRAQSPDGSLKRQHVIRWVIKDQAKFKELVQNFRELVDDLEKLTSSSETHAMRDKVLRQSLKEWPLECLQAAEEAGQDDDHDAVSIASADILDQRTIDETSVHNEQQPDRSVVGPYPRFGARLSAWYRMVVAVMDDSVKFPSGLSIRQGRAGDVCWTEVWRTQSDRLCFWINVSVVEELLHQDVTIKDFQPFVRLDTAPNITTGDLPVVATTPGMHIRTPRMAVIGHKQDLKIEQSRDGGRPTGVCVAYMESKHTIKPGYFKPLFAGVHTPNGFRSHNSEGDENAPSKLTRVSMLESFKILDSLEHVLDLSLPQIVKRSWTQITGE